MLVHLPIGILLIALLLLLLAQWEKLELSRSSMHVILGFGSGMAVLSCLTGYLLSTTGDYDRDAVDLHQWMAIFLTLASLAAWYLYYEYWLRDRVLYLVSLVVFFSLAATGHLGASLTHGSNYLIEPLTAGRQKAFDFSAIQVAEAKYYDDIIAPIFQNRCVSCHGPEKQKGKLRLDQKVFITRGGKTGRAIVPGSAGDSELWHRLTLPKDDDDHMPPKEKEQLTDQEKEVIKKWIDTGADFEKRVSELMGDQLSQLFELSSQHVVADIPTNEVAAPDAAVVNALISEGVSITPVYAGSHYLSVSFISVPVEAQALLPELAKIGKNIVWLKFSGCKLDDQAIALLSSFPHLTRLSLDDTRITDTALVSVAGLTSLVYLNLKGTWITAEGLEKLNSHPRLQEVYLFQTKIDSAERAKLRSGFSKTHLDFGGYQVPSLATDTTVLKAAKK